jgi:3-oxoacyl-[acyl-carrier protein] reductase
MDLGLDGRAVLVTGGSGGIGQVVCRAFAAEGALVAVHYHANRQRAAALAAELPGVAVGGDLTTEDGAAATVGGAVAALGGLDACVHAAGVWPSEPAPLWELDLARWEATLRVDLTAAFLVARAFLRQVAAQDHGNLVFIGSTAAVFGDAAAKAAVVYGLVRSLKNEIVRVAPAGRVNAVCPKGVRALPRPRDP